MSRIWIVSGDGPTWTPPTQRPTNRVHRAGSRISTASRSPMVGPVSIGSVSGKRTGAPVTAETSRARPTMHRHVAPIRLHVDIEDDIAVEIGQRRAERAVGRQDEDAVAIRGQPQLVARAEHPVADDAHLLGALDPSVTGQDGTRQRHRDALSWGDVRRAADDLQRLAGAKRDRRQGQAVGTRMLLDREQLADDDVLPVGTPRLDPLDLHAEQRQAFRELLG